MLEEPQERGVFPHLAGGYYGGAAAPPRTLGRGYYWASPSTVRRVDSQELFLVTRVSKESVNEKMLRGFKNELEICRSLLSMPNIKALVDMVEEGSSLYLVYSAPPCMIRRPKPSSTCAFMAAAATSPQVSAQGPCMGAPGISAAEHPSGCFEEDYVEEVTLLEYLTAHGPPRGSEQKLAEIRQIFSQVIVALAYCHERLIVHRDLKLPSILVHPATGDARLSDFSLARRLSSEDQPLTDRAGSPAYASPEMLMGKPYCGQTADCWSAGVVLFCMLFGSYPFDGSDPRQLFQNILRGNVRWPAGGGSSDDLVQLAQALLHPNPAERPTAARLVSPTSSEPPALSPADELDQTVPEL